MTSRAAFATLDCMRTHTPSAPPLPQQPARLEPPPPAPAPWVAVWRALRARWLEPATPHEAVCVVDAATLASTWPSRAPLAALHDPGRDPDAGIVLVFDHRHPGARDALRTVQATLPAVARAAVVVGVEHVADGDAATLAAYRDATGMPVFGVDLRRAGDRALLAEAIVGVRVLAELHRRWHLNPQPRLATSVRMS